MNYENANIDYNMFYKLQGEKVSKCESIDDLYIAFDIKNRRIKKTVISGNLISTVFLVINHNFSHEDNPLLFETLVFPDCEICKQYKTYDEAIIGHAEIVNMLKQKEIENEQKTRDN